MALGNGRANTTPIPAGNSSTAAKTKDAVSRPAVFIDQSSDENSGQTSHGARFAGPAAERAGPHGVEACGCGESEGTRRRSRVRSADARVWCCEWEDGV